MNWMFEWKCRRCAVVFCGRTYVKESVDIQDVLRDSTTNNPTAQIRIPREHPHRCEDHGAGIGDLIGAHKEESAPVLRAVKSNV